MLKKLLPDEEVVVLPRVDHIGGSAAYRFIKRAFDVASCFAALVLLCIPMAIIACKIKAESPGPVIFAQRRVGLDGKVFKIYKFRSMRTDAEVAGAQWATEDDPRVTKTGKFLRKTRLDEIPQFWNVVRGDMSLIGPRPERPAFHEEFEKRIHGWSQRTMVRPGVTGLAQVSGGYDLLPKEKALFDITYIENRSLKMDWGIIWHTLKTMITGEGAR
ncbi:MAG: sugar transferase [Coriobacteriia bacterium]|nr:sugar transferase [Coriobacteriia bacterium]MBS5478712.1 sugar transferase [Coriobacteriia bacterium]